jgi:hypothetical protein
MWSEYIKYTSRLLEGNETGRVGGTNTGTTVLNGLVGDAVDETVNIKFNIGYTKQYKVDTYENSAR